MTQDQRQRVRKLQDKLCTRATRYKGVNEKACAQCESPCGYGVEMLSCLMVEPPKRWRERDGSCSIELVRSRKTRRIIRSMNKGMGR